MKTFILTLLLSIMIMSCTKQNPISKQIITAPINIVNEDYTTPFFLRNKFHYHKDLNTTFIIQAKLGC
jgi:hypothetical protein